MKALAVIALAAAAALGTITSASAQYPPPGGACELSLSVSTTTVGDTVTATVKLVDNSGDPIGGREVTFSVNGDVIDSETTGGNGQASTSFEVRGSGTVTVKADSDDLECQASFTSEVRGISRGPSPQVGTGDGSLAEGSSAGTFGTVELGLFAVIAGLAIAGGAYLLTVRRTN